MSNLRVTDLETAAGVARRYNGMGNCMGGATEGWGGVIGGGTGGSSVWFVCLVGLRWAGDGAFSRN